MRQAGLAAELERLRGVYRRAGRGLAERREGRGVFQLPLRLVARQSEMDLFKHRVAARTHQCHLVQARIGNADFERRSQAGRHRRWLIGRRRAFHGQAGHVQFADGDAFREELEWRPVDVDVVCHDVLRLAAVADVAQVHAVVQRAGHARHFDLATAGAGHFLHQHLQGRFAAQEPEGAAQQHGQGSDGDQYVAGPAARFFRRWRGRGVRRPGSHIGHQKVNPREKCKRYLWTAWP